MADAMPGTRRYLAVGVSSRPRNMRIYAAQLCEFTRQLATLVGAGVPLLQSLDTIQQGVNAQAMGPVVKALRQQVSAGKSLETALQQTGVFDKLY